jgi:hypothetical protein
MATQLKKQYGELILADTKLLGTVASAAGRSVDTIQRWVINKDEKLTMFTVLNAIREYLKLAKSVTLTEDVAKVSVPEEK